MCGHDTEQINLRCLYMYTVAFVQEAPVVVIVVSEHWPNKASKYLIRNPFLERVLVVSMLALDNRY